MKLNKTSWFGGILVFSIVFGTSFTAMVMAAGTEHTFTQNCGIDTDPQTGKCTCTGQCDRSDGESKQCNNTAASGSAAKDECECSCDKLWD